MKNVIQHQCKVIKVLECSIWRSNFLYALFGYKHTENKTTAKFKIYNLQSVNLQFSPLKPGTLNLKVLSLFLSLQYTTQNLWHVRTKNAR